jgi:ribosome biogenesis GTPase A
VGLNGPGIVPPSTGPIRQQPMLPMLPTKSIEQKTLEALERIEQLLLRLVDQREETPVDIDVEDVVKSITPTETPFMRQAGKGKPQVGKRK